jgi:hypothetical protein
MEVQELQKFNNNRSAEVQHEKFRNPFCAERQRPIGTQTCKNRRMAEA